MQLGLKIIFILIRFMIVLDKMFGNCVKKSSRELFFYGVFEMVDIDELMVI